MLGDYRIRGRRATEIAADVEHAVVTGVLPPEAALPPLRELAAELGVNPNTVAAAYRLLRDRGVIETAGRRGSRVRARPALTSRDAVRLAVPEGVRDLAQGNPDTVLLPDLEQAALEAARAHAVRPVLYGGPALDPRLRALAEASFAADGAPVGPVGSIASVGSVWGEPEEGEAATVGVASGSLDAIERIFLAWLRPGDTVAVEDPGWSSLLDLLPALGLKPVPVAVDDDGPLVQDVARTLAEGARALVVTSRAQNPTGAAVGPERASDLRAVLSHHPDVLLVEDDHGHGIVDLPCRLLCAGPDGRPVTAHWAVVRSAAKSLGPDLRVAVLTGDAQTLDRVRGRQRLGAGWVSHLLQRTVAALWAAEDTAPAAASYRARRDGLLAELAARGVPARGRSGLNVWIPVSDETATVAGLLQRGWVVAAGARFRIGSPPGVRVTVSSLTEEELPRLAADVAAVLRVRGGDVRGV
ncbi:aminotransferase class I/II-fold pyridoxal phosphate-dependent enzyme [Streptacidiphilus sp. PB12-B1b]|uniref:aminotransferase class I/II-fold pyridoxal phosphate-dependent enzyme n=1 Tax=Streptacidiphilus sp. PB12-B1b TaxID=2705012 RepID=UPI0015FBF425|nr:aminotransferase class I/II-fold pyridoxal phosphate-dependent enzyme [Streptacidiphilus sp. PB12-B1b]QMU77551.1 aminotransferase class I/II-fold pyridoxal phosphate-dependent enzyme [Streptacidiphilus sp. PB12-B1b]